MREEWDENYHRGYEWWMMKEAKQVCWSPWVSGVVDSVLQATVILAGVTFAALCCVFNSKEKSRHQAVRVALGISWLARRRRLVTLQKLQPNGSLHREVDSWSFAASQSHHRLRWGSYSCEVCFYHAAIMRPLVHDLIVVEVSSHTAKLVPVQSYNSFLDQRS